MFCDKCGQPQAEGVRFCASCGNPMTPPPRTGAVPPAVSARPPATPQKSNTLLYVLMGLAVFALIGVAVAVIFLTAPAPPQPTAAPVSPTAAITATPAPVSPTALPTAAASIGVTTGYREFTTPSFHSGVLGSAIPGSNWKLAGIATNPDQTAGTEGIYTLDDFRDYSMALDFGADGTLYVTRTSSGEEDTFDVAYTLYDTYCECEDDGYGNIARFYLGSDGNLYLTFVYDGEEVYDFTVFTRAS